MAAPVAIGLTTGDDIGAVAETMLEFAVAVSPDDAKLAVPVGPTTWLVRLADIERPELAMIAAECV